jgi:hypothetical protein
LLRTYQIPAAPAHLLAGLVDGFAATPGSRAIRETVGLGFNLRGHAAQGRVPYPRRTSTARSGVESATRGAHRGVDVDLGAAGVRAHHDVVARAASVEPSRHAPSVLVPPMIIGQCGYRSISAVVVLMCAPDPFR